MIAPGNTRIETLRRFKELIAVQLTRNGSEAFRLHLPMHELHLFEKLQGIHFFSIDKQWFERMLIRNFETSQESHCFSIDKRWFGSILIAPANARIETLRSFMCFIALQLTSNDLEAFEWHLQIHE